jgi:FAD/FMN-containing dehydrogenase
MVLRTTKLDQILDFDKGNLTLTVQSGAILENVRAQIEKENRYLWMSGKGTVGGVIASKSSVVPPIRDLILGMRILLPNGEIIKLGAKTMKNVAGYDAAKLLIGSWGTLAIILDVTFRLYPYPAPSLKAVDARPFVFKDIHKKVKKAFDPDGILSTRMTLLTAEEAAAPPDMGPEIGKRPPDIGNMADRFWL